MAVRRKTGFTLIELLVVIAVLSILIALLMPAVQSAREAMRRADCTNRLRQLSLALHNYHEQHRILPSGSIVAGPSFRTLSGWGWAAMLLPFIDQGPLYQRLDFATGTATVHNRPFITSPVPLMRCPTDAAPQSVTVPITGYPDVAFATGNYVGSEGMLSGLSHVRFSEVTDGLSQTLLLGERLFHADVDGSVAYSSGWCGVLTEADVYVFNSSPHVAASPTTLINKSITTPGNFSSRHPGGVNFTMGDGSARFVSENIDNDLLQALGTPRGGEVIEF